MQFRAALVPFGAKDDPNDAELLLDLLTHHRARLRPTWSRVLRPSLRNVAVRIYTFAGRIGYLNVGVLSR
jgi:hypothetical protein